MDGVSISFENKKGENRLRWNTNADESLLFIRYGMNKLNVLDVEKQKLLQKNPVQLDQSNPINHSTLIFKNICNASSSDFTIWIDVCQVDGNLLASCGQDEHVKVFDRRESRIVKIFQNIHTGKTSSHSSK